MNLIAYLQKRWTAFCQSRSLACETRICYWNPFHGWKLFVDHYSYGILRYPWLHETWINKGVPNPAFAPGKEILLLAESTTWFTAARRCWYIDHNLSDDNRHLDCVDRPALHGQGCVNPSYIRPTIASPPRLVILRQVLPEVRTELFQRSSLAIKDN